MDRQLAIHHLEDSYYVVFHNYMGPWEGHLIAKWIHCEEIDAPAEPGPDALEVGQCFLWNPMDRHPDLHAKVPKRELLQLARAVEHFHVSVREGADALPEIPEELREVHNDASYIEYIDKQHEPVWQRGPRAVVNAFLIRAIPAVVVVFAMMVISRHMTEPYQDVELQAMFAMADRPAVEQSWIGGILDPDRSDRFRHRFHAVRFMEGNRILLADGTYFAFEGLKDVRPMLHAAQDNFTAPTIYARAEGGHLRVDEVRVSSESFARNTTLRMLAKFPPTNDEPARGAESSNFMFAKVRLPGLDDEAAVRDLADRRISVEGTLTVADDGGYILRSGTAGIRLAPSRHPGVAKALAEFSTTGDAVRVDLVLEPYPLRGAAPNRRGTGLLGSGQVYSMSVSNFHIVAQR